MKKCPECQRTYDDNLSYCLQDGTALMTSIGDEFSAEAETQIKAKPIPAPTQPSVYPNPADNPTILSSQTTSDTRKPQKNKINFFLLAALFIALGVIVGGGLVLFLGGFSKNQISATNQNSDDKLNLKTPEPQVEEDQTPEVEDEEPSEENVNDNLENDNLEEETNEPTETPTPEPEVCYLSDGGSGGEVNVRRDCDTLDCTTNPATIARTYSNKTSVTKLGKSVRSDDYTWEKVSINGGTFWVADSKIRCD